MAGNLRNNLPHTDEYLYSVYGQTKAEMMNRFKQDKISTTKARKLEKFFNMIKTGKVQTNQGFGKVWSEANQIALINKLRSINPSLFKSNLFTASTSKSHKLGQFLEEAVNTTISTFNKAVTSPLKVTTPRQRRTYNTFGVGNKKLDLTEILLDEARSDIELAYQKTSEGLHNFKHKNDQMVFDGITYMPEVQGKIDSVGLNAHIRISSSISAIEADLVDALTNATFTDKNVLSNRQLRLGQTNPFRVFLTIPAFNRNVQRWQRMLNCFEYHTTKGLHTEGPRYFYKIRIIYELTGYGGQYSSITQDVFGDILGDMPFAKYIIINQPSGYLRVIPTSQLLNINSIFERSENRAVKDWKYAVYGPVNLSQYQIKLAGI